MVSWTRISLVWPNRGPWTNGFTGAPNAKLWAPDCQVVNGKSHSAIFYAYSTTGAPGSFAHCVLVIQTTPANDYDMGIFLGLTSADDEVFIEAIDPNSSMDPVYYLVFDSYGSGISGQNPTNPDTMMRLSANYDSLIKRTVGNSSTEEAPVVYTYKGFGISSMHGIRMIGIMRRGGALSMYVLAFFNDVYPSPFSFNFSFYSKFLLNWNLY
ncbi:hypothetical protein C8J56DRAFT_1170983 [Mycena floridula]|nr:hypothetical protein C8J56DRAFT_1170983 [Mycena floridula]